MDKAEIYDRLYVLASQVLAKHDPCGSCGKCEYFGGKVSGCCRGCPFLGATGCTIESLGCKLWLCHDDRLFRWPLHPRVRHQLKRLENIANRHGINFARATKEEALAASEDAYEMDNPDKRKWWLYYDHERGAY